MITNHAKSYLQSEESKENNTNVNLERKRRCAQLLKFTTKRKQPPPPPPPPPSPLNLIEVDVPPPPPPPLLGTSGPNSSNDHQNSESNSTGNNSDGNNNECFHVDEPMEIDPNNAETKILAQNPLPDRIKKGSFFTFEIAGFEDAARRMAQMKEEQSFEERMAFIVGRIVEHEQIERKKELDKRLNREDVRMRNEMLKMKVHAAIQSETIVQSAEQQEQVPIEHQNQQQEQWNAPVIEAIENGQQNNSQENVMIEEVEQSEKWPPLQLIDGISVPFSWKTFLENLRTDMAASEAAAAIANSSTSAMPSTENSVEITNQNEKETANDECENGNNEGQQNEESTTKIAAERLLEMKMEVEDGEIIEFDDLRVKTPPPLKKRKRKSGANSSKAKKNLEPELLIVLHD